MEKVMVAEVGIRENLEEKEVRQTIERRKRDIKNLEKKRQKLKARNQDDSKVVDRIDHLIMLNDQKRPKHVNRSELRKIQAPYHW